MNKDEVLKFILNFLSNIFIWIILVIVVVIMYFIFNAELYEKFIKFLIPFLIYSLGIIFVTFWRKRKNENLIRGGSEVGKSIYITQWDRWKHDLVMFVTPLIMLAVTKFYKGSVGGFDIFLSAIAFIGLYVSELIYFKK